MRYPRLESPAYHALVALKDTQSRLTYRDHLNHQRRRPVVSRDNDGRAFFVIELMGEANALTLSGDVYQCSRAPHISVDKYYQDNERHGLSVFHVTWYGQSSAGDSVELHIYFNRECVYQYYRCKLKTAVVAAKASVESEQVTTTEQQLILSSVEESAVRNYGYRVALPILETLRDYVNNQYGVVNSQVQRLLDQLDRLSANLVTNRQRYLTRAQACIAQLRLRSRWSYGRVDPVIGLLEGNVALLQRQPLVVSSSASSGGLFGDQRASSAKGSVTTGRSRGRRSARKRRGGRRGQVKKQSQSQLQPLSAALQAKLQPINKQLLENQSLKTTERMKWVLTRRELLLKKREILVADQSMASGGEEIAVCQQLNEHQQVLDEVFAGAVLAGDLAAVKALGSYVRHVSWELFTNFLFRSLPNQLAICEYLIDNFDECLFYMNYCIVAAARKSSAGWAGDRLQASWSLLHEVFYVGGVTSFGLVKLLLSRGVKCKAQCRTEIDSIEYLRLAVRLGLQDHAALLLSEYRADPNEVMVARTLRSKFITKVDSKTIRRAERAITAKREDHLSQLPQLQPILHDAISLEDVAMVKMLLAHGASVTVRDEKGADAIGVATCQLKANNKVIKPNFAIVKLLITHGSDINAFHKSGDSYYTPLMFACQHRCNWLPQLIELGADPNRLAKVKMGIGGRIPFSVPVSPLSVALLQNYAEGVEYLINQNSQLIQFSTLIDALALAMNQLLLSGVGKILVRNDKLIITMHKAGTLIDKLMVHQCPTLDDKQQKRMVIGQLVKANKLLNAGKHADAIHPLLVVVLSVAETNLAQRHGAFFKLAVCYRHLGFINLAEFFFNFCVEHKPDSKIGRQAKEQLDELQGVNNSAVVKLLR